MQPSKTPIKRSGQPLYSAKVLGDLHYEYPQIKISEVPKTLNLGLVPDRVEGWVRALGFPPFFSFPGPPGLTRAADRKRTVGLPSSSHRQIRAIRRSTSKELSLVSPGGPGPTD